jgi:hypothetical protein
VPWSFFAANSAGVSSASQLCGRWWLVASRQAARSRAASAIVGKIPTFRHSSRSRPLKLSMKPFSVGHPGRMKANWTPRPCAQTSISLRANSLPFIRKLLRKALSLLDDPIVVHAPNIPQQRLVQDGLRRGLTGSTRLRHTLFLKPSGSLEAPQVVGA